MNTLTIKVEESIIDKATKYAKSKKISLSQLITDYLQTLGEEDAKPQFEISPFVRSISDGGSVPLDIEKDKEDYINYLEKKYK